MSIDTRMLGNPVNKTAAKVISRGERFEVCPGSPEGVMLNAPEITIPVPKHRRDLTGMRKGRLVVVGLVKIHKKRGAYWAVRCSCGNYHRRREKALLNASNTNDMCGECYKHNRLAREYFSANFFKIHGVWPHQSSSLKAKKIIERYG